MKRILITGARGFIGRNLYDFLSSRQKLFVPGHQELDFTDVEKVSDYILQNRIQVVINCAVTNNFELNLRMFFNIYRCRDIFEKVIHFGSGAEYDKARDIVRINESEFGKRIPKDNYGFYKYICSQFILGSENMVCLRLFGVYGKYEDYLFKFISNAIVKNLLHMEIVIGQNVYFDYLYINDLMKITEYFINHISYYRDYNAVTGERVDLIRIANIINEAGNFKSKIVIRNPGMNREYTADNTRLKNEINFLEFTPIKTAIGEIYKWYKDNLTLIDKKRIKEDLYLRQLKIKK